MGPIKLTRDNFEVSLQPSGDVELMSNGCSTTLSLGMLNRLLVGIDFRKEIVLHLTKKAKEDSYQLERLAARRQGDTINLHQIDSLGITDTAVIGCVDMFDLAKFIGRSQQHFLMEGSDENR